jgi:hypothetical protein
MRSQEAHRICQRAARSPFRALSAARCHGEDRSWSINSICHTFGKEEFEVRDKSRSGLLARDLVLRRVLAQPAPCRPPACARHGVLKGQIDNRRADNLPGREAHNVRRPDEARLTEKQTAKSRKLGSMTKRATAEPVG